MGEPTAPPPSEAEKRTQSVRRAGLRTRIRNRWPEDRDFRILSIDGGGIKGLLAAKFLAELERQYTEEQNIGSYFDLLVGTSTGGLICCALGAGLTANETYKRYLECGGSIFPNRFLGAVRHYVWQKRDSHALWAMIDKVCGNRLICESQFRLCIPSCEAKNRGVYIWKTPHHPDYRNDWADPLAAAAKSTTAAPTYFRQFFFGSYPMLDGGLYANNPSLIGAVEALSAFDVRPDQIKILSLGCGDWGGPSIGFIKKFSGGLLAWYDIYKWFFHFQDRHVVGATKLLVGPENYYRINPVIEFPEVQLDDFSGAKQRLLPIAENLVASYGTTIAERFLVNAASPYTPTYMKSSPPQPIEQQA